MSDRPQRWLVTGGTGLVGLALRRQAPAGLEIVAPTRAELDLARLPSLDLSGYTAIVNCAAFTAVDRAEGEVALAETINAHAPGQLAQAAALHDLPIIHVSTDYVFGGIGNAPFREDSPLHPINAYGRTKAGGERAVRNSGAKHAIVRTAWVFSVNGNNFVKTMLRLGAMRETIQVVSDQHGTPTCADDLASALFEIARCFVDDPDLPSGTWHCANYGEATWYELACRVFAKAEGLGITVPGKVEAIATAAYPTDAPRPADSRLDCSKIARDFGIRLRPWQEAVDEVVTILAQQDQYS